VASGVVVTDGLYFFVPSIVCGLLVLGYGWWRTK
jgi:hypothetical protein